MSRYIDADELIKIGLQDGAYEYVSVDEIANFPTADVKSVVRGEWIDANPSDPLDPRVTCSICENTEVLNKANFCPNCGAEMRERREDECY